MLLWVMSLTTRRRGRLAWRVDAEGTRSLCIDVPSDGRPLTVLARVPPVWVDPATGESGPIELDVAPELVPRLLGTERASAIRPVSARSGEGVELRPITVKRHRAVTPTPRLRLSAATGDEPRGTLTFLYGGIEVDPAGTGAHAARLEGDVLHQVHRDRAAEADVALALARAGGELLREGARVRLHLRSPEAWLEFSRVVVPELRRAGWQIECDADWAWDVVEADDWYVEQFDEASEGGDWFLLELGVEIDGERVNILPAVVEAIAAGEIQRHRVRAPTEPFALRIDRRAVLVPPERLQAIVDVLVELHADVALHAQRLRIAGISAARLLELEDFTWRGRGNLRALEEALGRLRSPPIAEPQIGRAHV